MKINRNALLNVLSKVLPGIETGTVTIEGADTVIFNNGHAYSYNSAISVDAKCSEGLDLVGVVKGQDFYNCLSKLPGDEIEIEITDKTWDIKDDKIKVSLKLLEKGDLLKRFESLVPTEDWVDIDGDDFVNALKTCQIPGNSSDYAGVYFNKGLALSTNRCIINRYVLKDEYPEFWISDSVVKELLKYNNFTKVQFNKTWVQFLSEDNVVFSARCLSISAYPVQTVNSLLMNKVGAPVAFTLELNEQFYGALNRASDFSHNLDEYSVVTVEFGKEVKVKSNRTSGNYEEVIEGLSVDLPQPKELAFDFKEFLTSEKFFKTFKVVADSPDFSTDVQLYCLLENECAVKLFSSIV